jgi:hypothetical protein
MTYQQWPTPPKMEIDPKKEYTAIFKTDKGDITVKLFADKTPNTVNNFVFLARQGFYDDTIFHRVISDFMAQGGDPTGTGMGGCFRWQMQGRIRMGHNFLSHMCPLHGLIKNTAFLDR